jgi:hypothetical protein
VALIDLRVNIFNKAEKLPLEEMNSQQKRFFSFEEAIQAPHFPYLLPQHHLC